MSSEQQTTSAEQVWNAAQYEEALAHLEKLQEQLDGLRNTVPSLVTPLVIRGNSKTQVYAGIKKAAIESTDDLRTFRETWTSEQTQKILSMSESSLEKDGDLSKVTAGRHYGESE